MDQFEINKAITKAEALMNNVHFKALVSEHFNALVEQKASGKKNK